MKDAIGIDSTPHLFNIIFDYNQFFSKNFFSSKKRQNMTCSDYDLQ